MPARCNGCTRSPSTCPTRLRQSAASSFGQPTLLTPSNKQLVEQDSSWFVSNSDLLLAELEASRPVEHRLDRSASTGAQSRSLAEARSSTNGNVRDHIGRGRDPSLEHCHSSSRQLWSQPFDGRLLCSRQSNFALPQATSARSGWARCLEASEIIPARLQDSCRSHAINSRNLRHRSQRTLPGSQDIGSSQCSCA